MNKELNNKDPVLKEDLQTNPNGVYFYVWSDIAAGVSVYLDKPVDGAAVDQ